MRTNIYKDKILEVLRGKHLLRMSDIHAALPQADYSTIFRNVESLHKEGLLRKVMLDGKTVAYESALDRHDHFICTSCGAVESIHVPIATESMAGRSVSDVTVRGLCAACYTQRSEVIE